MSIMCPKPSIIKFSLKQRARGFSLVAAIFLLVIMSALGAFMLSISTMQQTTSTQDLQGSKAYQAAKAGIEWGVYQVMKAENSIPPGPVLAPSDCSVATGLPVFGGALQGFKVSVTCALSPYVEGGNTVRVYQLTSTASLGTDTKATTYVERSMSASVNTCRVGALNSSAPC
ncbi:MAG: pilus assembly PilX N-terminal domain-containing protein [Burkholderiales bacterium]|nr:pilus assembly PilX N-terminal domain-containing protein [Burkholderiales bacterium]